MKKFGEVSSAAKPLVAALLLVAFLSSQVSPVSAAGKQVVYDRRLPFYLVNATLNLGIGGGTGIDSGSPRTFESMRFSGDGMKLIVAKNGENNGVDSILSTYDMITKYNYSDIWYGLITPTDFAMPTNPATGTDYQPHTMTFSSDGTKLFIGTGSQKSILRYDLSTPYDITTIPVDHQPDSIYTAPNAPEWSIDGLAINSTGTKLFVGSTGASGVLKELTLSTPYDLSSVQSHSPASDLDVSGKVPNGHRLSFSRDGDRMYILSSDQTPYASQILYEYTLSVPYSISSATFYGESSSNNNRGKDTDIEVAPDGFSYFVPYRDGCCAADFAIPAIPNAFTETAPNIGEVAGSMGFRLYDETFADPDGDGLLDVGSQITITGLPSGLTPTVKLYDTDGVTANTSGTSAYGVVELSGHATQHENSHDVSTLHVEFLDAAFTGNNAGAVASSNDPSVPVTIDFTDNNPPTNIALTNSNVADGTSSGSTVGTITFSDSDSGNTHSVTLASGTGDEDNGLFSINGSNQLVLGFTANHSNPSDSNGDNIYKVRVAVNDGITTSYKTFELPVVIVHGPAAVKANIATWLRADNGTGVSTNSATVGSWTDKSGNNRDYTGSGTPSYQNAASDLANFNPIVRYSQVTDVSTNNSAASVGNSTMYVVGRPLAASDWRTLFRDEHSSLAPSNHPFLVPSGGATSGFYIDPGGYRPTNVSWADNELALMRVKYPSGTGTINISKNGASGVDSVAGPVSGIFRHLGSNAVNPSQPFGDVAEIVIYSSNSQSIADERKIQSYLALKYGTGLSASVGQYVNTSGATVYNTSSYNSRVTGIAHDDQLDQRVSKSSSAGAMMTLASSGDFTSQNGGARPQLNEGQYFVVGDNNDSLTAQTSEMDATRYGSRVGREWKVANTGGVTNTHLKFDGFNASYALVVDDDGDFSSGASTLAMLDTNGEVHGVTIADGKYMTLATMAVRSIEFSASSATSTNESTASNLPKLLVSGTIATNQTVELSRTGGTAGSGEYGFTSPTVVTIPAGTYDGTVATAVALSGLSLSDDSIDDGNKTITFTIANPSSGLVVGDADNDTVGQSSFTYTITDDDSTGVTLSQTGSTTVEGTTETYNVVLTSQPTANVVITPTASNTNATVSPASLTFTPANWSTPQVVSLAATNNSVVDSPELSTNVSHSVSSSDSTYNAFVVTSYALTIQDNDTPPPTNDSDGDGVLNTTEDSGFNGGDGNGDGIADKTQLDVATSVNPATGISATLVIDGACNNVSESRFVSESMLAKPDATADYPVGLVDFRASCVGLGLSTTITIFYSQAYDTSSWRYKKYDSTGKEYADITSRVTFGTAIVGGKSVTTASFVATDGDPQTDEDKTANGVIVDPSGPAVLVASTSLAHKLLDTGKAILLISIVASMITVTAFVIVHYRSQTGR